MLVFVGLAILIFVIARIVPGDPARIALGPLASAAQVAEMRIEMGLDSSFLEQLWTYLSGLAAGFLTLPLLTGVTRSRYRLFDGRPHRASTR